MSTTETPISRPRLSPAQRRALELMSAERFDGARELGIRGDTIVALERAGLVKAALTRSPHKRIVGRLTPAGVRERFDLKLDEHLATLSAAGPEALLLGDVVALWVHGRISREALDEAIDRRGKAAAHEADVATAAALVIEELDRAGEALTVRELSDRLGGHATGVAIVCAIDRLIDRGHATRGAKRIVAGVGSSLVELRKGLRTIDNPEAGR